MKKSTYWIILVLLAVVIVAAAVLLTPASQPAQQPVDQPSDQINGETEPATSALLAGPNAIFAADQAPGDAVIVSAAALENSGYVVIHESENGAPGAIMGASALLPAGGSENVEVTLNRTSQDGETLIAMLHVDDGDGVWNPADDTPVVDENGDIVLMSFTTAEGEELPSDVAF